RAQMRAATERARADTRPLRVDSGARMSDDELRAAGRQHALTLLDRALWLGEPLDISDIAAVSVWVSIAVVRDEVLRQITRQNAEQHAQVWTHIARHVVPPYEAPVLALAGFSRWLCGDGTQALIALERALSADSTFEFAQTLMEALRSGLHPRVWDAV